MISESELGLDELWTSPYIMFYNTIIIFPKTLERKYIKYLISLGFTCVFNHIQTNESIGYSRLQIGTWLNNRYDNMDQIDKFLTEHEHDLRIMTDAYTKYLFISTYNLQLFKTS